jgi:sarcosine oxidase delta subunit
VSEPKPCPYCGDDPKTDYFAVNPMFGGGYAWRVECPNCHFAEGIEYRNRDDAVDGWNAFVDEIESEQ